jgi:hypothetical protein
MALYKYWLSHQTNLLGTGSVPPQPHLAGVEIVQISANRTPGDTLLRVIYQVQMGMTFTPTAAQYIPCWWNDSQATSCVGWAPGPAYPFPYLGQLDQERILGFDDMNVSGANDPRNTLISSARWQSTTVQDFEGMRKADAAGSTFPTVSLAMNYAQKDGYGLPAGSPYCTYAIYSSIRVLWGSPSPS